MTPLILSAEAVEYPVAYTPADGVLVALGFLMILSFMALIMTRRLTPMVALIVVPTIFGLIAGAGSASATWSSTRSATWRPPPLC